MAQLGPTIGVLLLKIRILKEPAEPGILLVVQLLPVPPFRIEALPPGGMCQYKVKLTNPAEVDAELIGWIKKAYDEA